MEYHAHIYWTTSEQRVQALKIRDSLVALGCQVGRAHDAAIGPHPTVMFQAVYNTDTQLQVESLLAYMRQDLSILLHESVNDDVRDHTEEARWLGDKLKLDLVWLEEYTKGR